MLSGSQIAQLFPKREEGVKHVLKRKDRDAFWWRLTLSLAPHRPKIVPDPEERATLRITLTMSLPLLDFGGCVKQCKN